MSEENLEIYRIAKVLQTIKEIWYSFFHTTCESKKNASMLFLMYNLFHITTLSMLIWSATSISNTLMFVAFINLLPPFSHHHHLTKNIMVHEKGFSWPPWPQCQLHAGLFILKCCRYTYLNGWCKANCFFPSVFMDHINLHIYETKYLRVD